MNKYWKGVDLDGTLAKVDYTRPYDPYYIGPPVHAMVLRVKNWLSEGENIKIFTARVSSEVPTQERERVITLIKEYCKEHIGQELEVTAEKNYWMTELWDDRVVPVMRNEGVVLGGILDE
jgi:hypothetical protein